LVVVPAVAVVLVIGFFLVVVAVEEELEINLYRITLHALKYKLNVLTTQ